MNYSPLFTSGTTTFSRESVEEFRKLNLLEMATVGELKRKLSTMDENLSVVIYPKYSADEVDGFKKHTINIDNVCEQEPFATSIINDQEALIRYFDGRNPEDYELNNHVAIIF